MVKKKYKLTHKELTNPGVGKLLANENEQLKESLKKTQDAHEELRGKYNEVDKKVAILTEKLDIHIRVEVIKILISVAIGYVTNLITTNYSNFKLILLIIFVCIYVVFVVIQYKNKKNKI